MRVRQLAIPAVCGVLIVGLFSGCSSANKKSDVQPAGGPGASKSSVSSSPTPTSVPASPFEDDPAVKALRAWAAQAAKTVNGGNYDDASLDVLMTSDFRVGMKDIMGGEVGHYYPGPFPFAPIAISKVSSTERHVDLCVVAGGYSQNPLTHQPADPHQVMAIMAGARNVNGVWLVSQFRTGSFSCTGVKVSESSW